MNEQELIERIILEIEKYGIEVIRDNYFPLDAVTHNRKKITIFNPKTVKAFKLCHELMHIKNNDRTLRIMIATVLANVIPLVLQKGRLTKGLFFCYGIGL